MAAALITGATGGLGRVLAFEHVRHGGDVILVDCHAAKLQALSAELRRDGVVDALGGPGLPLVAETVGVGRDCGLTMAPPVTAGRLENNVKL